MLLCPSAPGEAPAGVEFTGDPRFNSIWTLAGTPCVTLPAGTGANGLPLGIQLVGLRHEDDRLLSTAAWVAAHLELRLIVMPRSTANAFLPTCAASPISAATRPACIARTCRRRMSRAGTGSPAA